MKTVQHFRTGFHDYVGPTEALQRRGESLGRRWRRGITVCRTLWNQHEGMGHAAQGPPDFS